MKVHRASRLLLASLVLLTPAALSAQGFGLSEIGSCAIARGFATTASPCKDASTIFWNPAAATAINGWSAVVGAASIAVNGDFRQDTTNRRWESNVPTVITPHAFVNYHRADSKAAFGLGFYVPYGLTSQWTNDFPGRFSAKKAALATFYIQPNFAWQINPNWSIGGGPIYGHSTVELIQAVDLSSQKTPSGATFGQLGVAAGTEFARVRLKGSGNGFGAQVGLSGKLADGWRVGARYLSPVAFKYDNADATFTQVATNLLVGGDLAAPFVKGAKIDDLVAPQFASGGALVAQKVATRIIHPAQVQAGLAYSGAKNWLLEADYAWIGWKQFTDLPVSFQGPASASSRDLLELYNNSSAIRLSAEYTIPTEGWKLRAGFAGVASAAPPETVTPLLPEQDRAYFNFGVGVPLLKTWTLDGAYSRVSTPGARGRIIERTSRTQTADDLNSGVYSLSANIFSITLKANF